MNNGSCAIPHGNDPKGYIINCAGEKVPVAEAGFTARCAIGNTDDYLKRFQDSIIPEIVALGEPAPISVVIPSCASDEQGLFQTLRSLCWQEYPVGVEILVLINEPQNASESVQKANAQNEKWIRSLVDPASANISPEAKRLRDALFKNQGAITLRCVRQVLDGGLAGVYQMATAAFVARVRAFCDEKAAGCQRPEKAACIEQYLRECMILFCDDDMEFNDMHAIAEAYRQAVTNDAVVLGRLEITRVETVQKYRNVLRALMQLFFEFKYDHGLNFLTPRGMRLKNILSVGGVKVGEPFADQVFFASAARGREQFLLEAATSIGESDHPGNGNFLKKLRLYLEGEDNDALEIFQNVLKRYQEDRHKGRYGAQDIERLILSLETRDIRAIYSVTSELLKDFFIH